MVRCKYTYPEPCGPLESYTLLSGDKDKMVHANELAKVTLCGHKENPRHLQNGSESQEMKSPWKGSEDKVEEERNIFPEDVFMY